MKNLNHNQQPEENENMTGKQMIAVILLFIILSAFLTGIGKANAEEANEFDFENEDYEGVIILDDPAYFMDMDSDEGYTTPTDMEITEDTSEEQPATEAPEADMDENAESLSTPVPTEDPIEYDPEEVPDTDQLATEAPEASEDTAAPDPVSTPTPEITDDPEPDPTSTPKPQKKKTKAPTLYDIPQELLDADPAFAALMEEANKYVGYPYVWGGSNPRTSFDCSGFVSWVFTETGVSNTGRKGATGLYKLCTEVAAEDARPGDLVFFKGTMGPDVPGVTHVGIYVGNGWMIHCGDPIGYADLTQGKWPKRFFTFGRLPYEGVYADVQED